MVDTLTTLTVEAKQYYEKKLLFRARQAQIFYRFANLTSWGDNSGNSASWRRVNAFSLATTALIDGVTPTTAPISMTEVTATVSEYGNYCALSDNLLKMGIDKLMPELSNALGQNGGESIEQVIMNTIQAGTTVIYATGSARSSQGTSNVITLALLRKALATLDNNNTHRFAGPLENDRMGQGNYIAFMHPWVINDLLNDSELKNALQYHSNDKLFSGSVMSVYGIEIFQSTLCPVFSAAGSAGANVYGTLIIGQEAFGAVDIGGSGKFELVEQPLGSAGAADPLKQRATMGWKAWQVPVILNNNFFVRIETGTTNG